MIEIKNVSLKYANGSEDSPLEALQDINLSINKGERCVIIGPSGCGKSSLLFLLAGLFVPSQGSITVAGKEVREPREEIALILQNHGLFPWKTVMSNAELGLLIRKIPRERRRERVLHLLETLNIREQINKFPSQLSGGQQQRVAIARALAQEPQVLLMDEPFSALDALTREQLQNIMLNLWREKNLTYVLVTHSIEEAVFLGEKIVVLSAQPGRIVEIINNKNSGWDFYRKSQEFYNQCSYIRSVLEGEII